ncbi:Glutamine amidotransferase, class I [hydrothermal vent metagenome]|uniref:Glutamine amidotransferase, class I n=1 Tax=hydrothermal vent metagenome TaxID=652676 RepID=A0A3B0YFQ4_9ZZZZ
MKIGILEADILDEDVQRKYGNYTDMFKELFLSVDSNLSFVSYNVVSFERPVDINECDAYLITGSKFSAYDKDEWIYKLKDLIVELVKHQKKLIGICFGHQIIADALGGEVKKSKKGWGVGCMLSDVKINKNGLKPIKKSFNLLVSHQDQVTKMPANAMLVAGSDFCPVSSFSISDYVLSFQGHPEFNESYLKLIMRKRRDKIGEQVYKNAIESLNNQPNSKEVAQCILNFIKL